MGKRGKYIGTFKVPLNINIDLTYALATICEAILGGIQDEKYVSSANLDVDEDDDLSLTGEYEVLGDAYYAPATYYDPEEYDYELRFELSEEAIKDYIFHNTSEIIEAIQKGITLSEPELEDIEEETDDDC